MLAASCALNFLGGGERRASWRDQEERVCLSERRVVETAHIQRVKKVNGRGACGIDRPLHVSAFSDGRISIGPTATLGCPMTAAVESWLETSVQPAAIAWFGMPVTEIRQMSTYFCRPRNNVHGARLSEHSFGNALDISGFVFPDGSKVTVKGDFLRGSPEAQGFLREVYAGACARFKTVLGPGARYHGDHFHLDIAHHNGNGTSRYCKPTPSEPPHRPPYRGDRMAGYPTEPGPMLADAPEAVAADMSDPFGVAAAQESRGIPDGSGIMAAPQDDIGAEDYGVADDSADQASSADYSGADYTQGPPADPNYQPPEPDVRTSAAQPRDWSPPPRRKKQGFLSWFFKPTPSEDIPLSYAPEQ